MSSTLNRVLYELRAAKNVERKMMCDVFALLSRITPLSRYRYIGMGALGFHDHALVHQRLGIRDMISIEKNLEWKERVNLNRPYKCIHMEWGASGEVLPELSWKKPSIVWLDFDSQLDRSMLDDVHTVTANASSGTMLIVTATAQPEEHEPLIQAPQFRLDRLLERVGEEKVPSDVKGKDLAAWGLAKVVRSIILNEIADVLAQRNEPLHEEQRLTCSQLFNFRYADGTKMMTLGALLATPGDTSRFEGPGFGDFDFVRTGVDAFEIELPKLTLKELRFLNRYLPNTPSALKRDLKKLPPVHVERYARLYRYFPQFTEVETSL